MYGRGTAGVAVCASVNGSLGALTYENGIHFRRVASVRQANTAMVAKRVELLTKLKAFEESKLEDLKSMLRDFIQAQMWYFSRGLETLSRAYEEIDGIEKEADMKELTLLQRATRIADEADAKGDSAPGTPPPPPRKAKAWDPTATDDEAEEEEEEEEDRTTKKKKKKALALTARSPDSGEEDTATGSDHDTDDQEEH